jgi:hypothetical protein
MLSRLAAAAASGLSSLHRRALKAAYGVGDIARARFDEHGAAIQAMSSAVAMSVDR